jgi:hypothetical protein
MTTGRRSKLSKLSGGLRHFDVVGHRTGAA